MATARTVTHPYVVSAILLLRAKLRTVLRPFLTRTITHEVLEQLHAKLLPVFPGKVHPDAVLRSLQSLLGTTLSTTSAYEVVQRLAGNCWRLQQGKTVSPWMGQPYEELVPVQVIGARRYRTKRGRIGYVFTMHILGGLAAGQEMTHFWTDKMAAYLAKTFGFAGRPRSENAEVSPYRFRHPRELVGMRFLAELRPGDQEGSPAFQHMKVSAACLEWNKELIRKRARADAKHKCPRKYPTLPCFQCLLGYVSCPAGTHKHDYTLQPCGICGNKQAPFSPELSQTVCLNCSEQRVVAKKK